MFKPSYNKNTKVWLGPKVPPLYNPDQNLGQLILRVLEQTPDAVTQISDDTGVAITCGEMRERILKIASHLSGLGLKQGDVAGIIATNTENLAPTVFACFLLGLPVNPLAPIMVEGDIVKIYSKMKPKIIFCDEINLLTVQNAVNLMEIDPKIYTMMKTGGDYESVENVLKTCSDKLTEFPDVDPNSIIYIMCTSGTTGTPKGASKSHIEIITHFVPTYEFAGNRVFYQFFFIYWFSGIYFMLMSTLQKSVRIITAERATTDLLIKIIHKYKVTNVMTAPFAVANLLQTPNLQPFESMRDWIIAGAATSKVLCEKFSKYVPNGVVSSGYGCSEYTFLTYDTKGEKFGSCGRVVDNTELKIIDENGNALDNGEKGEVCVRRNLPFLGYFNDTEKSTSAYDGDWFKTGDAGYFDDEGFFFFKARNKEVLKYANYQIIPLELESIINEIAGVVSSCVVGVTQEDTGNDIIHAFVIVNGLSGLTEEIILNNVNAKVSDPKKLRGGVHFIDTFPVGFSGKVDRRRILKMAEEISKIH